ncbi:RNAse P Rpr2/Rpp21/SNM1 subunit domain-containing protein [Halteromyces radiatus]|uniref:RNAse P Rpr2/Rpp21/SNM1 subunit domain-containing protein n=1 Tax=Halteromyces radiatus TaxID=101107 RepID=UPI00222022E0|nr:RNAse P Rpr2/Rpp21/SNM1 subunit domain-containing protein [Halteromyces radiatus]KAI8097216.1 RNAse P Rpr2/Rpp21/SNM1 subunit domain-containing protein [Halteromyces radiatus]
MGKKQMKTNIPGATQQHLRMNFLYQAANLMTTLSDPIPLQTNQPPPLDTTTKSVHRRRIQWQGNQGLHPLGRYYNTTMKKIGKRMVLRLDPHIKRSICKRCNNTLIPAMTSSVRIQSRAQAIMTTCNTCGQQKRLGASADYQLFNDRRDVHYNRSASDNDDDDDDDNGKIAENQVTVNTTNHKGKGRT